MKDRTVAGKTQAVCLLSGGLDSVAALFWARRKYQDVRAITFSYGQPARDAEVVSAGRAAAAADVRLCELALADALALNVGLLREAPAHDPAHVGIDRAVVPARNILFLTLAAAHGSVWFPDGRFDVVIGCNAEDEAGFPDCRSDFLIAATTALRLGTARDVAVRAPWLHMTKTEILRASEDCSLDVILASWSCYRREGPCGECSACVKRAVAIVECGLDDLCASPRIFGGDSERERRP